MDQFLARAYFSKFVWCETSARRFQAIDPSYIELFLPSHYLDAQNGCGL